MRCDPKDSAGPTGVGLGLRWSILDEVLERPDLDLDFFEISPENYMRRGGYFPEALHEVGESYPFRTHGLMMNLGGPSGPREDYLQELSRFLREIGVKDHSDHLCWSGSQGQILHDLLPIPLEKGHAQRVADHIRRAQDHLGLPMAVENISYYGQLGPGDGLREADFVAEVLHRADCNLLLDVNNVWVNAQNHGFDPLDYLKMMPLSRVVEIHIAGAERLPNMQDLWIDTHGAKILPSVIELMQWVLARRGAVPVLYERDHDIPPLDDLLVETRALKKAYKQALDEPCGWQDQATAPLESDPGLRQAQALFSQALLKPADQAPALPMPAARVDVYRQLVNNGLRGVCRRFMPRCAARRGAAFDQDLGRWLAGPGPRSNFLRDLPAEFFEYIQSHWQEDPACPDYLIDLGRHELIEFEVEAAADHAPDLAPGPLSLEDQLVFSGTACLLDYGYAVHELVDDPKDKAQPQARPCTLLAYRDEEHEVRFLELSPMARGLVSRLLDATPLGLAVLAQAQKDEAIVGEGQVEQSYLERVFALIGDLSQRGALLGPAA